MSLDEVAFQDQGFQFGSAYLNKYLASITVQELSGVLATSQTALSAITVESALPEPSTILLLMTGLGAIGFSRMRRK